MTNKLAGQVAVITGSSRSIGASIAKRYAREGARVVVNYRSHPELAERVVQEIAEQGGEAFAYGADVSSEREVQGMVAATIERYGTIDILVNNAAMDPRKTWYEITAEDWDHLMGVNVRSQFLCAKAVFPFMKEQGYGRIINVSSVTFFTGPKNLLHYVASKGAIIGFTRALAREVGNDGITVNCITPGAIKTETELEKVGSIEVLKRDEASLKGLQCIPDRVTAPDLEGAFVFLASKECAFITGQTLNVDGGLIMH